GAQHGMDVRATRVRRSLNVGFIASGLSILISAISRFRTALRRGDRRVTVQAFGELGPDVGQGGGREPRVPLPWVGASCAGRRSIKCPPLAGSAMSTIWAARLGWDR